MPQKYTRYEDRFLNTANVVHYYALIRDLKPSVVVETGTAAGSMTSWILAALSANNHGRLISIDLPARAGTGTMDMSVFQTGYLIPGEYRDRWELTEGDAAVHLPSVLLDNEVDVFIHDSLHTRSHMLFEYNVARRLLKPGAIIISDDVLWNRAWLDFVESHDLQSVGCITNPNQALTVNTYTAYELSQTPGLEPLANSTN